MDDLLSSFEYRSSFLRPVDSRTADDRVSGLWKWMVTQPPIVRLIDRMVEEYSGKEILQAAEARTPNPYLVAESPEEIACIGYLLMEEISKGADGRDLCLKYGIEPPELRATIHRYYDYLFDQFIFPAIGFTSRELAALLANSAHISVAEKLHPLEITESLDKFHRDYPDPRRAAFVMMQFGTTRVHTEILAEIRACLAKFDIVALRADDKQYHDDLFPNVQTYMHGCGFGIALFERLQSDDFNPNVSLEVGYMRALRKSVCLLKDSTLQTLQTDLVGKLYKSFDPQQIPQTLPNELTTWLRDKDIIT